MNDTLPGSGMREEKLAFSDTLGDGLITPRQLGPTRRTPALRHSSLICVSILAPSPPTSLNPAETMTMPLTPLVMHSWTEARAALGGRMIMARSMGSGILVTLV